MFTVSKARYLLDAKKDSLTRLADIAIDLARLMGIARQSDTAFLLTLTKDTKSFQFSVPVESHVGLPTDIQQFLVLADTSTGTTVSEIVARYQLSAGDLSEMLCLMDSLEISAFDRAYQGSGVHFFMETPSLGGGAGLGCRRDSMSETSFLGLDSVVVLDKSWYWFYQGR